VDRLGPTEVGGGGTPFVISGMDFKVRWRVLRASSSRVRRGSFEEGKAWIALVVGSISMGTTTKTSGDCAMFFFCIFDFCLEASDFWRFRGEWEI